MQTLIIIKREAGMVILISKYTSEDGKFPGTEGPVQESTLHLVVMCPKTVTVPQTFLCLVTWTVLSTCQVSLSWDLADPHFLETIGAKRHFLSPNIQGVYCPSALPT